MNLTCCTCSRERVKPAENVVLETFLTTCIDIIVRLNHYQKWRATLEHDAFYLSKVLLRLNLLNFLAFETCPQCRFNLHVMCSVTIS